MEEGDEGGAVAKCAARFVKARQGVLHSHTSHRCAPTHPQHLPAARVAGVHLHNVVTKLPAKQGGSGGLAWRGESKKGVGRKTNKAQRCECNQPTLKWWQPSLNDDAATRSPCLPGRPPTNAGRTTNQCCPRPQIVRPLRRHLLLGEVNGVPVLQPRGQRVHLPRVAQVV